MRRRAFLRTLAALGLLLVGVSFVMLYLVRREPASYRQVQLPDEPQRRKLSGDFVSGVQQLLDSIGNNADDRWEKTFTTDQMNSYFSEDFVRSRPVKLPAGIHSPRIQIEPGRLQLAFRYGHGFWSSVISVDMRPFGSSRTRPTWSRWNSPDSRRGLAVLNAVGSGANRGDLPAMECGCDLVSP